MKKFKCKKCGSDDIAITLPMEAVDPNSETTIKDFLISLINEDRIESDEGYCNKCNDYCELSLEDNKIAYAYVETGDFVICNNCDAYMLLPTGADKCPRCEKVGCLAWVNDNRNDLSFDELKTLNYQVIDEDTLNYKDFLSPQVLSQEYHYLYNTWLLPVYWAPAILNDDYSGYTKEETEQIDQFLKKAGGIPIIADIDNSAFNDAFHKGCECCEYLFTKH